MEPYSCQRYCFVAIEPSLLLQVSATCESAYVWHCLVSPPWWPWPPIPSCGRCVCNARAALVDEWAACMHSWSLGLCHSPLTWNGCHIQQTSLNLFHIQPPVYDYCPSLPPPLHSLPFPSPSHRLSAIIEATGAATYHGFLPSLVRDCVASFTSPSSSNSASISPSPGNDEFPLFFATALFSFLYHLATYEASELAATTHTDRSWLWDGLCFRHWITPLFLHVPLPPSLPPPGGDALVSSGIMESLLEVLEWKAFEPMNITVSTE